MELPKFLIADNSDFEDKIYIVHTEYPRFILDVDSEEFEWLDPLEEDSESNLDAEVAELIDLAYEFFDKEMAQFDDDEEE